MNGHEMTQRLLESWVESFYDYTNKLPSPQIFRRWAGISAVAGALERKTFLRTSQGPVYPNLYTFLCGPPGVGKTELTKRVRELLISLESHHVSASSVTGAALVDELSEADRTVIVPSKATMMFNSLFVLSNELSTLLPGYDGEIMGVRHQSLDIEGVQFHPESILTEHGKEMLQNFLNI